MAPWESVEEGVPPADPESVELGVPVEEEEVEMEGEGI